MSVEVKTPTKAQFQHPQFPCGDKKPSPAVLTEHKPVKPVFQRQESYPGKIQRKRRYSERMADSRHGNNPFKRRFGGNVHGHGRREKIVLPTKFLLGGNINDPLNLNGLFDETGNPFNNLTPVSSPLPLPAHRKHVEVLIPPNITDPLNLNSGEDVNLISPKGGNTGRKRRKHKYKRRSQTEESLGEQIGSNQEQLTEAAKDFSKPMHIEIISDSEAGPESAPSGTEATTPGSAPSSAKGKKSFIDKIVSPVVPQTSPKSRKRKRTSSCGEVSSNIARTLLREDSDKSTKSDKVSPHRPKYKRQQSNQSTQSQGQTKPKDFRGEKSNKFIYGNYNRYYGYRNPGTEEDQRLKCFQPDWFEGKDVLDIGCNVGHVTLTIARDFRPHKIIGTDIDGQLIKAAKRNVRHYLSSQMTDTTKFPNSMASCYGPIAAPSMPKVDQQAEFPNNFAFVQANYVLDRDELLDTVHEEYDVILGLSLTKWMHVNFGDDGLKRAFKRMYRQLRPGGKLILEPQSWASYKKKKKLSEKIFETFKKIRLRPDQFTEFLLSREVGFSKCEQLETPFNKSKGFQRPLQVYTKSETAFPTPLRDVQSGWTPAGTSRGGTPMSGFGSTSGYGFATPIQGCATPNRSTRDLESTVTTPKFVVGSRPGSGAATPSTYENCSRCATPSQDTEKSPSNQRTLDELRTWSAPGLLETSAFSKLQYLKDKVPKPDFEEVVASKPDLEETITAKPEYVEAVASKSDSEEMVASKPDVEETVTSKPESMQNADLKMISGQKEKPEVVDSKDASVSEENEKIK